MLYVNSFNLIHVLTELGSDYNFVKSFRPSGILDVSDARKTIDFITGLWSC